MQFYFIEIAQFRYKKSLVKFLIKNKTSRKIYSKHKKIYIFFSQIHSHSIIICVVFAKTIFLIFLLLCIWCHNCYKTHLPNQLTTQPNINIKISLQKYLKYLCTCIRKGVYVFYVKGTFSACKFHTQKSWRKKKN